MDFSWSDTWNTPGAVYAVVSALHRLTIHSERKKEILLDWCKEVDYPYTHDLFLWLWEEITEEEYRSRQPTAP